MADHPSCQHVAYRMTCDEFDALAARAGGSCEVCGVACDLLWIDHDHGGGWSAVRGLLCPRCNALLRRVDSGERAASSDVRRYLANPFRQSA